MPTEPLFSIVTPCLNRSHMIRDAIESVTNQHYPNIEHIIIDGGSTDGTLELLGDYPKLIVLSESDCGMYDAINKGFRLATGEWIGLLNSDDLYAEHALQSVADAIMQNPAVEVVFGDTTVFSKSTDGAWQTLSEIRSGKAEHFTLNTFQTGAHINACFIKRSLLNRIGDYDTQYRIVGDLDYLLRMGICGPAMIHTNRVLYHLRSHPGSLTVNQDLNALNKRLSEEIRLWRNWLNHKDLPTNSRRYCQERYGNACFALATWHASEHRWRQAIQRTQQGWQLAPQQMAYRSKQLLQIKVPSPFRSMFV